MAPIWESAAAKTPGVALMKMDVTENSGAARKYSISRCVHSPGAPISWCFHKMASCCVECAARVSVVKGGVLRRSLPTLKLFRGGAEAADYGTTLPVRHPARSL